MTMASALVIYFPSPPLSLAAKGGCFISGEKVFTDYSRPKGHDVGTMKTFITPEKQGFRDFDLPKEHLISDRHFIPAKTHDRSEEMRRREMRPGTLIVEQQAKGLNVARTILENISDEEGLLFAANTLAVAGLNSAWYSYAQRAHDVMRRRLKLPIMLHQRARQPASIVEDAKSLLKGAESEAAKLAWAMDRNSRRVDERQRNVGVRTGNMALRLATYEPVLSGDFGMVLDDESMQAHVREIALDALTSARTMHLVAGSHPSVAQLSDPYSELAVYWHRKAPGSIQSAVNDALAA